jgi:demethylmenaquinone methyltransferase/2-methoxy-6-polyprenyl-1,4-benzoquinol methylase
VIMEIVRPHSRLATFVLRLALKYALPLVTRLGTRSARANKLMRYFWETVANCVPPELVLQALSHTGFRDVRRTTTGPVLSEYLGTR